MDRAPRRGGLVGAGLLMLSVIAAPEARAQTCGPGHYFKTARSFAVQAYPIASASADFNADGLPDVAVANLSSGTVSILFGTVVGGFQPAVHIPAGLEPRDIAVADLNRDGAPDLVIASSAGRGITIIKGIASQGRATGAFAPPMTIDVGSVARGIAVRDLNGDGIPDAAAATEAGLAVLILHGTNGVWDGTFDPPALYPSTVLWQLAVADFNGDGVLDIAGAARFDNALQLFPGRAAGGQPTGTFDAPQPVAVGAAQGAITTADFNGDGAPDLAVTTMQLVVLLNQGNGTFVDGIFDVNAGFNAVTTGDINRDGIPDVVATGGVLTLLIGVGDGTFQLTERYLVGTAPVGVTVADLNRNDGQDVIVANTASNDVSVLTATCHGAGYPVLVSFTPQGGAVGDLVTLSGVNLGGITGVQFNGVPASFEIHDETTIVASVPAGATTGLITVTNAFHSDTSSTPFLVGEHPVLLSIDPDQVTAGMVARIAGAHLAGTLQVKFGGNSNAAFHVDSDEQLTVTIDAAAVSGPVTVTTRIGTTVSSFAVSVYARPVIGAFTPPGGAVGDVVSLHGAGFTGATRVRFNGVASGFMQILADSLVRTSVPDGATTGPVSIENPAATAVSAASFVVGERPVLTGVTPQQARPDETVRITGQHLASTLKVQFGAQSHAAFRVDSDEQLSATVDLAAVSGPVTVTTAIGTTVSTFTLTVLTPDSAARIVAVRDVPNDQGGRVFVSWMRSVADRAQARLVTAYRVWRRGPTSTAVGAGVTRPALEYWEEVAEIPATALIGYSCAAPTTQDSMRTGNPYTAFYVQTVTTNAITSYASAPDSGYSVDNLSPRPPGVPAASVVSGGVALEWQPADAPDLDGYRIYRSTTEDAWSAIATTRQTRWIDTSPAEAARYAIAAVDIHGNESQRAETAAPTSIGSDVPQLHVECPVASTLPVIVCAAGTAPAVLEVFDLNGRRIWRTGLVASPDARRVFVPLANVRPGVVLARLSQGRQVATARTIVLR